ncbi:MAG: hypothetical protein ABW321_32865 [Polyangiales bacterium]
MCDARHAQADWKEDPLANVSSKPSSPPPPEGLLWGEGESSTGRKQPERSPELKGVFGAGASVVTGPDIEKGSAAHSGPARDAQEGDPSTSGEHLAAQSRRRLEPPTNPALRAQGLWTNAARDTSEPPPPHQKVVNLPRAVLGEGPPSQPLRPQLDPVLPDAPVANENAQLPAAALQPSAAPEAPAVSTPVAAAPAVSTPAAPAAIKEWVSGPPSELERETPADRTVTLPPLLGGRRAPSEPLQPKAPEPAPAAPAAHEPAAPAPSAAPVTQPKAAEPAPQPKAPEPAVVPAPAAAAASGGPSVGMRLALVFAFALLLLLVLLGGGLFGLWRLPWSAPAPKPVPDAASSETHTATSTRSAPEEAVEARIAASRAELAKTAPSPSTPEQPAERAEPTEPTEPAQPAAAAPPTPAAEAAPQPSTTPSPAPAAPSPAPAAAQPAAPQPSAAAISPSRAEPGQPFNSDEFLRELRKARELIVAKNPAEAETLLLSWVDRAPTDPRVGELLTQAYLDQGQGEKALATMQQVVRKRPKRALSRVLLGDALDVTGNKAAAKAAWREALELDPNNKPAQRRVKE